MVCWSWEWNTCEMFLDCPHWLKIIIKNNLTIAFNNHTEKSFQMTRKDKEMSTYFSYGKEKSNCGGPTSMGSPVSFFSKVPVFSIPYNPWLAYSNLTANYSLLSKKFQLGCAFLLISEAFKEQLTSHRFNNSLHRFTSFHESLFPLLINLINHIDSLLISHRIS